MSSISQEWKDEKHDLLTEGQSFSSLDEEGKDTELKPQEFFLSFLVFFFNFILFLNFTILY